MLNVEKRLIYLIFCWVFVLISQNIAWNVTMYWNTPFRMTLFHVLCSYSSHKSEWMRNHLTKAEVVSLIYSMVSPLRMPSLQLWLLSLSNNYSFNWNNYLESVKETSKPWGPSLHQSELQPPRLWEQTKMWISQPSSVSCISGFLYIWFKPKSSSEFDHVARTTNPSVFRQAEKNSDADNSCTGMHTVHRNS